MTATLLIFAIEQTSQKVPNSDHELPATVLVAAAGVLLTLIFGVSIWYYNRHAKRREDRRDVLAKGRLEIGLNDARTILDDVGTPWRCANVRISNPSSTETAIEQVELIVNVFHESQTITHVFEHDSNAFAAARGSRMPLSMIDPHAQIAANGAIDGWLAFDVDATTLMMYVASMQIDVKAVRGDLTTIEIVHFPQQ